MGQQSQVPTSVLGVAVGFSSFCRAYPLGGGTGSFDSAYTLNRPSRPHYYGEQTRGCLRFMTIDNRHLGLHAAYCVQYQSQGFDCYFALQCPARPGQSQAVPLVRTAAGCAY